MRAAQTTEREALRSLILNRALKFSEGISASSTLMKWTFDLREVALDPHGIKFIASLMYERLKDEEFDAIGGPSIAAEPLAAALILHFFSKGRKVNGFVIRKEANNFPLRKIIEGPVKKKDKVILVDDLLNIGRGKSRAIVELEKEGIIIVRVLTIVDFMRVGNQELKDRGYEVDSLFTAGDFGLFVNRRYPYTQGLLQNIEQGAFTEIRRKEGTLVSEEVEISSDSGVLECRRGVKTEWSLALGEKISPFLIDGDTLVVGAFSGLGRSMLHLISAGEGKSMMRIPLKGEVKSKPLLFKDNYLVCSDEGALLCIGKDPKEVRWRFKAEGGLEEWLFVFEESDDVFLVSSRGDLHCLDAGGNEKWRRHLAQKRIKKIAKGNGNLIAVSDRDILFCLDEANGEVLWLHESKDSIIDVICEEDRILALCERGVLIWLDRRSGEVVRCARAQNKDFKRFLQRNGKITVECEDGEEFHVSKE